jgi:hypothetical protein
MDFSCTMVSAMLWILDTPANRPGDMGRVMSKTLHFSFYDAGAYDGETEHRIMVSFFSITNGERRVGQSELVLASEWPTFRQHIERNGWQASVA